MSRRRRNRAIAPLGDVETAGEALDRYYSEESSARGGLFTPGGASAGGIFGDAQIATEQFDGAAAHRHLSAVREAGLGNVTRELAASRRMKAKLLRRVEELERKQLGGRRRGPVRGDDDDESDDELDDEFDDDEVY